MSPGGWDGVGAGRKGGRGRGTCLGKLGTAGIGFEACGNGCGLNWGRRGSGFGGGKCGGLGTLGRDGGTGVFRVVADDIGTGLNCGATLFGLIGNCGGTKFGAWGIPVGFKARGLKPRFRDGDGLGIDLDPANIRFVLEELNFEVDTGTGRGVNCGAVLRGMGVKTGAVVVLLAAAEILAATNGRGLKLGRALMLALTRCRLNFEELFKGFGLKCCCCCCCCCCGCCGCERRFCWLKAKGGCRCVG